MAVGWGGMVTWNSLIVVVGQIVLGNNGLRTLVHNTIWLNWEISIGSVNITVGNGVFCNDS